MENESNRIAPGFAGFVQELTSLLRAKAAGNSLELDLTEELDEEPLCSNIEICKEILYRLEGEFIWERKDISVLVAPVSDKESLLRTLMRCDVITEVRVKRTSSGAQEFFEFLQKNFYVTTPVRLA